MQYIIHIFAQLESGILSTRGVIYYTLGIIEHHGIQNKIKPLCAAPPFQPVLTGIFAGALVLLHDCFLPS